ncbi:salivary glue protein Sgs-3-like [Haliotis rubra]|uniref:salivary glue protein Sgs-3-like n=1 Tax=Haliotis rubra TaxID=36100 RepID=UPI001EE5E960|nr:salivary glue protein Sgs-3-like [Haliotis rubra]
MCIPVNTAKGHICVRVAAFIPQTTVARMTPKTATTTTTAATTYAAPPTTLEVTTTTTTTHMSASTTLNGTTTSAEPTTSAPTSTSAATMTTAPYNGTCVTDIDCAVPPGRTCSRGVCICSIGYGMGEISVECRRLTECTSFGLEFTLHVDKGIYMHDFKYINSKTSAECAQLCLHSDTVCKSFETFRNTCFLQKVTWFDVHDDDHRDNKGEEHYQRRCNW